MALKIWNRLRETPSVKMVKVFNCVCPHFGVCFLFAMSSEVRHSQTRARITEHHNRLHCLLRMISELLSKYTITAAFKFSLHLSLILFLILFASMFHTKRLSCITRYENTYVRKRERGRSNLK